ADSTNPRAAILFTPTATTTLKLLYGTAFRSPNVYETFYSDVAPLWKANPGLKPERVRETELEWQQRLTPEIFVVGSLFHTGVSDLIEQELTPEGDAYWYDNDINASSNGAEIKADFRRRDGVWAYLSYSLTNTHMDNSPRQLFKGGVSTSPFAPLHAGLEAVYESSRLTRDGGRSDPFLLLNATVSRQ